MEESKGMSVDLEATERFKQSMLMVKKENMQSRIIGFLSDWAPLLWWNVNSKQEEHTKSVFTCSISVTLCLVTHDMGVTLL